LAFCPQSLIAPISKIAERRRGYKLKTLSLGQQDKETTGLPLTTAPAPDATNDEKAKAFYERYGFQSFIMQPLKLFIPMATIEQLLNH
jgi:hypothetical protein